MPVHTLGQSPKSAQVVQIGPDNDNRPRGNRPKFFWHTDERGIPRYEDLITVRMLENTHTVRLPIDTIIKQVTTTPFTIRPTVDDPTDAHYEACDDLMAWFDSYNVNGRSFEHLLKAWVNDILSIDAGVIEKVPNEEGFLGEMYVRDGATFTKNPDQHGRLPPSDSREPAYYQFSMPQHSKLYFNPDAPDDILNRQHAAGMHYKGKPTPFTRSQIIWAEENPRSWQVYGRGRVQTVKRLVEIILNQDKSNLKYFPENEVPEGVINLVDANETQIQRFRQYWKDEVKGKEHKVALVGNQVDWLPFRPNPEELEFIESQKWYNKLCWMCFGVDQAEVGDLRDVNRANAVESNKKIYRQNTKPMLDLLEGYINNHMLKYRPEYRRVDGEVEFVFNSRNPEIEKMQRQQDIEDLKHGLKTPNQVLKSRGKDPVEWGDYPLMVLNNLASQHVDWVMDNIFDEEDPPQPAPAGGMFDADVDESKDEGDGNFFMSQNKDALRNTREDFPDMKSHVEALKTDLGRVIKRELGTLEDDVEEQYPDKDAHIQTKLANVSKIVGGINLTNQLLNEVLPHSKAAMDDGADHHRKKTEVALEERADEPVDVDIDFDTRDTYAYDRLKQNAARKMRTVNNTIKQRINQTLTNTVNEGGNVGDAIDALNEEVDQLSENHAELVARTEIIGASRHGSQAFAESTDLVKGKKWTASHDDRVRAWHEVMDGTVVPKDQDFTVPSVNDKSQPSNYPRDCYVVGEDQPFNCRCSQQPVLAEDMPDDIKDLDDLDNVKVHVLNDRQQEIKDKHADEDENLKHVLERVDNNRSRNKGAKHLNLSKPTYYNWLDQYDLK